MAEDSQGQAPAGTADQTGAKQPEQAPGPPPLTVNGQYVKDLSFENPRAPESLMQSAKEAPNVSVSVDVNARQIQEQSYEVVLVIRTEAKQGEEAAFLVELQYAGVFTLGKVAQEVLQALIFVEAPRLLFPFARAIIGECVRDGGFPPLLIQPIDFVALYRQRLAQAQAAAGAAESKPAAQQSTA